MSISDASAAAVSQPDSSRDAGRWAGGLVRDWVRASCREQGVPERIIDRHVLRQVAALLGGTVDSGAGAAGLSLVRELGAGDRGGRLGSGPLGVLA